MTAARDMGAYAAEAFFTYEAMRDARDEALTRCCELEDERDQARRWAARLFEVCAAVEDKLSEAELDDFDRVRNALQVLVAASMLAGAS
jgi:hypothetical protein